MSSSLVPHTDGPDLNSSALYSSVCLNLHAGLSVLMAESQRMIAEERSGHCAVVDGNCLYVWGGYMSIAENEVYLPSDEIWTYDIDMGIWETHSMEGDIPPPMSGGCEACLNGVMYIFGGYDDNGYTNQLYCVNLKDKNGKFTWTKVTDFKGCPPTPRDKLSCWVYDNRIIYFGGYGCKKLNEVNDSMSFYTDEVSWVGEMFWGWNNEVHVFNPATETWTQPVTQGTHPAPRAAHAGTTMGNKGYVFGGRVLGTRTNDIHCLDLDTWAWSEIIHSSIRRPVGRSWHTVTTVSDCMIFLFGGLSANSEPLDDGWLFDVQTKKWTQLQHLPKNKPRLWHTACLGTESEVFVFGGSQDDILSVDRGHCNDLLVFQTQPCTLLRLCLDYVVKNGRLLQEQLSWLPPKLSHKVQDKISLWTGAGKPHE
ncbi:kelch domain-containing protein 1 isoform X1 [Polyodon spathula]|uniref:kelch domain-containing protein 1 isoform X1 n=2 Tax=Polyodon spathula TaxID=7913 RepID=UPI001B7F4DD2|nr:kelch domain-containing protein 1 isoform X1 [Polyodon spathula]